MKHTTLQQGTFFDGGNTLDSLCHRDDVLVKEEKPVGLSPLIDLANRIWRKGTPRNSNAGRKPWFPMFKFIALLSILFFAFTGCGTNFQYFERPPSAGTEFCFKVRSSGAYYVGVVFDKDVFVQDLRAEAITENGQMNVLQLRNTNMPKNMSNIRVRLDLDAEEMFHFRVNYPASDAYKIKLYKFHEHNILSAWGYQYFMRKPVLVPNSNFKENQGLAISREVLQSKMRELIEKHGGNVPLEIYFRCKDKQCISFYLNNKKGSEEERKELNKRLAAAWSSE